MEMMQLLAYADAAAQLRVRGADWMDAVWI